MPGAQAEALADARPRAGRRLDDDVLLRVVDGAPDLVGRVVGVQRARRAAVDALPAVDAHHVAERLVEVRADARLVAPADGLEHAHFLDVDARAHAAAAQHALVRVADDRVARLVDRVLRLGDVAEPEEVDPVLLGQRLQLAVVVALAAVALAVVRREQQVDDVPARLAHLRRVGVDLDGGGHRVRARRLQGPLPLDLDHAHPADAGDAQVGVVAERGDPDAQLLGGIEDRRPERHLVVLAVDRDRDESADVAGRFPGGRRDALALLAHGRARRVVVLSGISAHGNILSGPGCGP